MLRSGSQGRRCRWGPDSKHPPGTPSLSLGWAGLPGTGNSGCPVSRGRGASGRTPVLPWALAACRGSRGSTPLRGQGDRALPPTEPSLRLLRAPLPWESPLALTNLLQETPTHRTAAGAAVPFTALSPALRKTNERDYLTDTSLLSPSITCGFSSEGCRLREWLYGPLSGSCLQAPDRPIPPWLFAGKGPQKAVPSGHNSPAASAEPPEGLSPWAGLGPPEAWPHGTP